MNVIYDDSAGERGDAACFKFEKKPSNDELNECGMLIITVVVMGMLYERRSYDALTYTLWTDECTQLYHNARRNSNIGYHTYVTT